MCGILGYINIDRSSNVIPDLIRTLHLLEYRGYDSSGIAVISQDSEIMVRKSLGGVSNLEYILKCDKPISSNIGIGHVRWASVGRADDTKNAHPHVAGHIAMVHNGNVLNYRELAKHYNITEIPESDSLTIAKILELLINSEFDIESAVRELANKIEGNFAILLLSEYLPNSIVAIKKGLPLSFAYDEHGVILSSDVDTLQRDNIMDLEDYDIAILNDSNYTIFNNGKPVIRNIKSINYSYNKKDDDSQNPMLSEIYYQPQALIDTLQHLYGIQNINEIISLMKNKFIVFVCCGSSYCAALIAKYWFEMYLGKPVKVEFASEFIDNCNYIDNDYFVVFISQSGQTADVLMALKRIGNIANTLSITNSVNSPLSKGTDFTLVMQAQQELAVAATKTFTSQLAVILFLLNKMKPDLPISLESLPAVMNLVLEKMSNISSSLSSILEKENNIITLGRNLSYAVAMEGALKLKELTYIHSEAIPIGELKHGSLALIDENIISIVIAPYNASFEKTLINIETIYSRKGNIIALTDAKGYPYLSRISNAILLPETDDFSLPFVYTIPFQILSYYTARRLKYNPNRPRNLAKSVTVE